MKILLSSHLGGCNKINGVREPVEFLHDNGLLQTMRWMWPESAKVVIVSADPDDYEKNDSVHRCMKAAFILSGLETTYVEKCDHRNMHVLDEIENIDVIIFGGGHVPTQNKFFKELNLKEKLKDYKGIVMGISAGTMNCANTVYASPELEGEAIDPNYNRWIDGLGLTDINIFPHFQELRNETLDGLRILEDITFPDSFTHEIIALNDGSYIVIDGDKKTLCGEAYSIRDGQMTQICNNGKSITL